MGPPGQLFAPPDFADAGMMVVAGSVTTAPTDGTRLVTGTTRGCGTSCGVAEGPFVLTDARVFDRGWYTWFYTVPMGTACGIATCNSVTVSVPADAGVVIDALLGLSTFRSGTASTHFDLASEMAGGRYFVPAGLRLCVCGFFVPGAGGFGPWQASWAGFVPYQ
jgi:hypothetical protein